MFIITEPMLQCHAERENVARHSLPTSCMLSLKNVHTKNILLKCIEVFCHFNGTLLIYGKSVREHFPGVFFKWKMAFQLTYFPLFNNRAIF